MLPAATSSNFLVRSGRAVLPAARYLMQTEVHVYAFSVSAGMLLSFFPFLIVMLSLCQHVLRWKAAVDAIYFALDDYFPDAFGHFLRRNFEVTVASHGPVQMVSIILLFFTASGIFEPLEVALNRIWRCPANRSYFKNQLVGLGLIFACGALMLISTTLTALNNQAFHYSSANVLGIVFYKLAAIPMSMLLLFLIYWLLPNCKIKPAQIVPAAIRRRIPARSPQEHQSSDVALSEGETGHGVWPVRLHGNDYSVGIRGVHGDPGRCGMECAPGDASSGGIRQPPMIPVSDMR